MDDMTPEQKRRLLQGASFLSIGGEFYRIDLCDETEFYYTDENSGEQYCEIYDEIDLYDPEVELYRLEQINIK
jgi:hypothetical protein